MIRHHDIDNAAATNLDPTIVDLQSYVEFSIRPISITPFNLTIVRCGYALPQVVRCHFDQCVQNLVCLFEAREGIRGGL